MIMDFSRPITGYMVHYNKVGSSDVLRLNVTSGTTCTISGLVPSVEYEVTVAAMSDDEEGPFSNPVLGITGGNGKLN